ERLQARVTFRAVGINDDLESGRKSYSSSAWASAHESFSRADRLEPLAAEDLESLATSAYMLGRDDESMQVLERAYRGYSEGAEARRAVRCAFWIGIQLALRGEMGLPRVGSAERKGCSTGRKASASSR